MSIYFITIQVERQSFLRTERDGRSRLPCDDRRKRDYEEKDGKLQSSHRQDRSRLDDRDRNIRSGDGPQSYMRHYQNNVPPRFLKQQAERNQSAASSNSVCFLEKFNKFKFRLLSIK